MQEYMKYSLKFLKMLKYYPRKKYDALAWSSVTTESNKQDILYWVEGSFT